MSSPPLEVDDRRAHLRHHLSLKMSCKSVDMGGGVPWQGECRDLSRQGIRIYTERSFQPQTMLLIDFKSTQELAVRSVMARVMWAERHPAGGWLVGCALMDFLTADEITALQSGAPSVSGQAAQPAQAYRIQHIGRLRERLASMSITIHLTSRRRASVATGSPVVRSARKTYPVLPTVTRPDPTTPRLTRPAVLRTEPPAKTPAAPPTSAPPPVTVAPAPPPAPVPAPAPPAPPPPAPVVDELFDQLAGQLEASDLRPARQTLRKLLQRSAGDVEYLEMLAQVNDQLGPQEVGPATVFAGHQCAVNSVAFAPDGERVYSGSGGTWIDGYYTDGEDLAVATWDPGEAKNATFFRELSSPAQVIASAPNGLNLLVAARDGTVLLVNSTDATIFRKVASHRRLLWTMACDPDGHHFLTGCDDGVVRLWDLAGKRLRRCTGHTRAVTSVALVPQSKQAVSGSLDSSVRVWDVGTAKCLHTLTGHGKAVLGVAVSPDGQQALSAGADGSLRLWDIPSGTEVRVLTGHEGAVASVAFTVDGARALSGGADGSVRLWDVATGAEVHRYTGHTGAVKCLALSPGGRRFASGGSDNSARVWVLPT